MTSRFGSSASISFCVRAIGGVGVIATIGAVHTPLRAQTPPRAQDPSRTQAPATPTSTVTGRVVEPGGVTAVRRAIVTLAGSALANGRSAITDDNGQFVLSNVPDGDFTVTASRPGFLTVAYGASRPGRSGTPISVRAARPVAPITMTMTHGSAIDGIMHDATGDIASNMRVEAIRLKGRSALAEGVTAGESITNDRGEFRIFGLAPGDYVLAATPRMVVGGMGDLGAPTEAEVDAKLAALSSRSQAPQPGSAPLPIPPHTGYSSPAVFYPGVVQSSQAVIVTLGANEERSGLDFGMRLVHAAKVSGQIISSRPGAMPMVQTEIMSDGPQLPVFGGSVGGPSLRMNGADHTFDITNVPPGHYRVNARTFGTPGSSQQLMSSGPLPKIDPSAVPLWGTAEFDVAGDDIGGVTVTLQPAPSVSGRATFEGATGVVGGAQITLEPIRGSRQSNGLSQSITTTVAADGTFAWPAIVPGAYRVSAPAGGGWWMKSATSGGTELLDGDFIVGPNGAIDMTAVFTKRQASIVGTLETSDGHAASGYYMVAFAADRTYWRAGSRRVKFVRPSTAGAFDIGGLPAGDYYLVALSDLDAADLQDPAFLDSLVTAGIKLTVADGQQTKQNLRIG